MSDLKTSIVTATERKLSEAPDFKFYQVIYVLSLDGCSVYPTVFKSIDDLMASRKEHYYEHLEDMSEDELDDSADELKDSDMKVGDMPVGDEDEAETTDEDEVDGPGVYNFLSFTDSDQIMTVFIDIRKPIYVYISVSRKVDKYTYVVSHNPCQKVNEVMNQIAIKPFDYHDIPSRGLGLALSVIK